MEIQVEKDHYELKNYVNTERWHSYYNQLCEIIAVTQNRMERDYLRELYECLEQ